MSVFKEPLYKACIEILCVQELLLQVELEVRSKAGRLTDVEIFQFKPRWTMDQHANSAPHR